MFEQFRQRRQQRRQQAAAQRAEDTYEGALANWQERHDAVAHLLQLVQTYQGDTTDELMLKKGEAVFGTVSNASLIEDRKGPGRWQGGSSGVSIPIGSIGGRSVRYHVGATRGHYVQGEPHPTAIDHGTFFITNQRAVFVGAKRTSECAYSKLVSCHHDDAEGITRLSVSNRQKATVVAYGKKIASWVDFRFDLALAHYRGDADKLAQHFQAELAQLDASKPAAPAPAAPAAPPAPPPAAAAAGDAPAPPPPPPPPEPAAPS